MRIQKTSQQPAGSGLLPGHLEDINRLSRASLSAQEVYAFSLCLCDNEVDRDQERFPEKTLEQLAPLFVGKSGLFDHSWSRGARLPGSTARRWCGSRSDSPRRGTATAG